MRYWKVRRSKLKGTIQIPASKSQSIRAILFASLAKGESRICNILPSPDVLAMIKACRLLGAKIEQCGDELHIMGFAGSINGAEDIIQADNSGLVARLIGAISALSHKPIVITGDHSVRHVRPIAPLLDALSQLGVEALSLRGDGGAPILVRGPLRPGPLVMCGRDSQPVSAMLIASAFASGPVEIFVTQAGEIPWVNLTLSWLRRLGIAHTARGSDYYRVEGQALIEGFSYTVAADFSSLSFPLAASVLTQSELVIDNLDFADPQGDKVIISFLQQMGACIEADEENGGVAVRGGSPMHGVTLDVNSCIDAIPLMAVMGCFAQGKTEIRGASIARKKESDRISCIVSELRKMGAEIEEHPDGFTVYYSNLKGAELHSYGDHRIALSLAVAGFAANGETVIKDICCTAKSYPGFLRQMQFLGAHISEY